MLYFINYRLNDALGVSETEAVFGGLSVIALGDCKLKKSLLIPIVAAVNFYIADDRKQILSLA